MCSRSAQECLAGLNPSRGTELCTVVEAMFSYTTIFSIIGDPVFADKAEQIALNALPASLTPDMWAHQYLQQSNEINAVHQESPWWNTDGGDSNLYGLEPNYGCCTANFPQGWPKYVTASWMLTQTDATTGVLAAFLGPSELRVTLEDPTHGNNSVHIQQVTDYPLKADADVQFLIRASHPFPLSIRIPGWAKGATLVDASGKATNVTAGTVHVYQYTASDTATITLRLPYPFRTARRYNNAISVYYGPLLLALDFGFNTTVLKRYAYDSVDLQYLPIDKWNFALLIDEANPAGSFNVSTAAVPAMPWDPLHPSITATAYAREIDWPMKHDSADEPPVSPVSSKNPLVPVSLIPYGATLLRIAEIPTLTQ